MGGRFKVRRGISLRGVGLLCVTGIAGIGGALAKHEPAVTVLVTGATSADAAAAVRADGGSVTTELDVIAGVVARVPTGHVTALRGDARVHSVTGDRTAAPQGVLSGTTYDPVVQAGSMYQTVRLLGINQSWSDGQTGVGVAVAVVDSGVAPSSFFGNRLVAGADFSGGNNSLSDGFGHGTHIAGIIAGSSGKVGNAKDFTGVAPGAKIVSVKVADASGATSLIKILQGIDWVYKNRAANNIKVLNLSLGAPAYPDYVNDPLAAAVERLWKNGVTVVASAGNIGQGKNLTSPAYDPYVISVGALDTNGTINADDDVPASFSASAATTADRGPDLVVPARSIQSLAAAGSTLVNKAGVAAKVGTSFIKGTGTSQAAAIVSGEVALLAAEDSLQSPEDIKSNLCSYARKGPWDDRLQGCGVATLPAGASELDLSRGHGSSHRNASASPTTADPSADLVTRGASWQGASWQGSSWQGSSWQGASWQGSSWQGSAG